MNQTWLPHDWNLDSSEAHGKVEAGLLKLCCDKALTRLGWQAILSFKETVELTAQWYKSYYGNASNMAEITGLQLLSYEDLAKQHNAIWTL
jgi:CDP-glucose 4,6-dehydratase